MSIAAERTSGLTFPVPIENTETLMPVAPMSRYAIVGLKFLILADAVSGAGFVSAALRPIPAMPMVIPAAPTCLTNERRERVFFIGGSLFESNVGI